MKKEDIFIKIIQNALPSSKDYIGDDTAFIKEKDIVITQDTLVEDVHFRTATISPYNLAQKAVAVNLSDIAAAGAVPSYLVISLSLPGHIKEDYIKEFYKGINDICTKYHVLTIGGDLTGGEKIVISITMLGNCNSIPPAARSNARVGDYIITTGEYGSSFMGFNILENPDNIYNLTDIEKEYFKNAHINPIPRVKEGLVIAEINKNNKLCMMDTSDGLADALFKISKLSNISMEIDYNSIPFNSALAKAVKSKSDIFNCILFGGEDYELVACVTQSTLKELKKNRVKFSVIGRVAKNFGSAKIIMKLDDKIFELTKNLLENNLFNHFKDDL